VGERERAVGREWGGPEEPGSGRRLAPQLGAASGGAGDPSGEGDRAAAGGSREPDAGGGRGRSAVPGQPVRLGEEVVAAAGAVDGVAIEFARELERAAGCVDDHAGEDGAAAGSTWLGGKPPRVTRSPTSRPEPSSCTSRSQVRLEASS